MIDAPSSSAELVEAVLARFGAGALAVAQRAGVRVTVLGRGRTLRRPFAALRRIAAGVDGWPVPPAGLFVVEERTIYLRSLSPMTIAHEFAHALDCALGSGVYLSGVDPRIRRAFAAATAYRHPVRCVGLRRVFRRVRARVRGSQRPALALAARHARAPVVGRPAHGRNRRVIVRIRPRRITTAGGQPQRGPVSNRMISTPRSSFIAATTALAAMPSIAQAAPVTVHAGTIPADVAAVVEFARDRG